MPSFEHVRTTLVATPPATARALVADFHAWRTWSPWEPLDPQLERTYGGPDEGVGARYAWAGKKAGAGSMVITAATPDRVDIDLDFERPIKAQNKVVFRFESEGDGSA
jgi:hypothetical protein